MQGWVFRISDFAFRPPKTAVQPPNSTIPCNLLYLLANPLLPFPMLRPQINPPRSFQRFSASDLATSHSSLATAPLTPFPATLSGKSQLIENPAALSPVVATLTRHVRHNLFVCHSYKKHPGGGYTLQPAISFRNLTTRHSPPATSRV